MNKLWEEFVYRRLKKEEVNSNILVQRQQSSNFWKTIYRSKTIRPDIVISINNRNIIIDTKWKIIDDLNPADEDLKQMFTYNLFWDCDKSVLLYPGQQSLSNKGEYYDFRNQNQFYTKCAIETIHIFDHELRLDKALGKKILDRILY